MKISERAYANAAQELECEVAAIKAFALVESNGGGFLPNGVPKILFEAHIFSRLTNGKYNVTHPRISSPSWNRSLYVGGSGEHFRLEQAAKLDRSAALQSASWGAFQILGENWKLCGYKSLQDFINAMYRSEDDHLEAFVGFIKGRGMKQALQKKNWKLLAKKYNGERYYENRYDIKLEQAYKRFLS